MLPAIFLAKFRAEFAVALFTCVVYGVYMVLAGLSTYFLLSQGQKYRGRQIILVYTACMSVVITLWLVTGSRMAAYQFVDVQFQPDLPNVTCSATAITAKMAVMLQILGSDAALIYRTFIIWERDARVVVPLAAIYLVSLGCGIVSELYCFSEWLADASTTLHMITILTSIALNVLTSLALAARLWRIRRACVVAAHGAERRVAGILAILIESAGLYTIVGIALIPTLVVDSPAATLLDALFQGIAVLSPAAIFLRVAMGVSFENNTPSLRSRPASRVTQSSSDSILTEKEYGLGSEFSV